MELDSIFIPFRQVDNEITRAEGSGLGLTISQQLVRLMGSELRVESEPGAGSHFWFDVDVVVVSDSGDAGAPSSAAEAPASAVTERTFTVPEAAFLEEFTEQVRRHNVLGLREMLTRLDGRPDCREFVEYVQPYVRSYRFKPLLEWLSRISPG